MMDLKKLIDPKTRHIFLASHLLSYACPIVHVEGEQLYFTSKHELPENLERGYFLALEGDGIVMFQSPSIQSLKHENAQKLGVKLHRLTFGSADYTITNRRQNIRHEFSDYIPIIFNIYGEVMAAQLVDISIGGLRMCVDTPLKKNILCQLEIRLPIDAGEILLNTNGLIMHSESADAPHKNLIGISFVTPDFVSEKERENYLMAMKMLENFIQDLS